MFTKKSEQLIKDKAQCHEVVLQYVPSLKKAGKDYMACCPFHNERSPSFHVDPIKNIYKCFGCGKGGDAINFLMEHEKMDYRAAITQLAQRYNVHLEEENDPKQKKVYVKPKWKDNPEIDRLIGAWFEMRKIHQKTLERLQITTGIESILQKSTHLYADELCIEFNYFRNGELVNIKYRDRFKNMKLFKNAELVYYNIDSLKGAKECYIVEGEPDVAAMVEAGYWKEGTGVVSVPNGANINGNNLTYIDNSIDDFAEIETIYIAVDNDAAGRKLREDLANRYGKSRCRYVEWKDKKDANDVLITYGIQGVIDCCSASKEFDIEGVFTVSHYSNEIDDMYENGLDIGMSFNLPGFGVRLVFGYLWLITGIPSHGKSEFVDELTGRLIQQAVYGAYYSPENKPTKLHFSKIASRFVGKSWDGTNKITKEEKDNAKDFLDKKAWWIKPEKDFSLGSILSKVLDLIKRYGIKWFVIDAWNKLEHKGGKDPAYIGRTLDELAYFCEVNNVTCFLVAHPTKMEKDKKDNLKVPGAYDINGSADFYNKGDVIISVYLNRDASGKALDVDIHRQKVKFKHWGFVGVSTYKYDMPSGRYYVEGCIDHKNWITGKLNIERVNEKVQNTIDESNPVVHTAANTLTDYDEVF